jgi:hypothetical protein
VQLQKEAPTANQPQLVVAQLHFVDEQYFPQRLNLDFACY